ncbi:MAG: phenylalanine--tRNA ligase subunit beta [Candidatus Freyarchaeota archaeon]|nr:phenylalanine--tRNA ligase subunit beta [Candidatus Jordarchaeia archaeon]
MPTLVLKVKRMSELLGREVTVEELERIVPWLGVDIEDVGSDYIKIEYNPNRPDFSSQEGIARALKGFMEIETGLPKYTVNPGPVVLKVDPSVRPVRPWIVCGVVRGLKLDEERIMEIIEMEEALDWAIGRDRAVSSIGLHNLDAVKPPFKYHAVWPDEIRFVPLDMDVEMTPKEILRVHPKGVAYRRILEGAERYPIITDCDGNVLSFPPIINGALTRVTEDTRNIFIELTGTRLEAIFAALNILVTAFAEMGGRLESVAVEYTDQVLVTPNLSPSRWMLNVKSANKLLGLKLKPEQVAKCLEKMRLGVESVGEELLVLVPAYRHDIMHNVDLIEEVAIGYGYFNLEPTFPSTVTIAAENSTQKLSNKLRMIMIGFGFTEVINFTLANYKEHFEYMMVKGDPVRILNPVSAEYDILRSSLLPCLLKVFGNNKHEPLPQMIFEVGDVIVLDDEAETGARRILHLAGAIMHSEANFTEIKSVAEGVLREIDVQDYVFKATDHPSFIPGRCAEVKVRGNHIGVVGEIHPKVLNNFELEYPVGAFEYDLQFILERE